MTRTIRPAQPADIPQILDLIHELADYENLTNELDLSAARLQQDVFEQPPRCEILVCKASEARPGLAGYALFFATWSTFKTKTCLFLEDLYVRKADRGEGHGKALLQAVAGIAMQRDCPRLAWNVLDWNTPAIDFYRGLGATLLSDWRVCRIEGEALAHLGHQAPQ